MKINNKGQMAGMIGILVSIIILVAVMVPITMHLATPSTVGTVINNTYTFSNAQGTGSYALNTIINGYKNTNVTEYSTATTANFTGKTNGTAAYLSLWVNGAKVATSVGQVTILSDGSYALNYSKASAYKFTVSSNQTNFANTTYWLFLKPKYYLTNAPNAPTINLLIYLIPLFVALLAIIIIARYIGVF